MIPQDTANALDRTCLWTTIFPVEPTGTGEVDRNVVPNVGRVMPYVAWHPKRGSSTTE